MPSAAPFDFAACYPRGLPTLTLLFPVLPLDAMMLLLAIAHASASQPAMSLCSLLLLAAASASSLLDPAFRLLMNAL